MELETGVNQAQSPSANNQPTEDTSKIIAKRISETRAKDRAELAAALGYSSWDEALNSGLNKKLVDAGIDPDAGKPIIQDMVENHPEVVRAKQILAEAEKAKQEADLTTLNAKYGLHIESINQVDDSVKNLMAKGLSLSQAYIAVHFDELQKPVSNPIDTAKAQQANSMNHLESTPGGAAKAEQTIVVSQEQVNNVRKYMPNASEEDVKKFLQKHPEYKI